MSKLTAREARGTEVSSSANGWQYETIQDLGSGLNYQKKGLQKLLKRIMLWYIKTPRQWCNKPGSIGIDLNPGSIGWAYVDYDGNLKAHGQIPLQMELPSGKQDAQIVDAILQLVTLATTFSCPIVCEELDFSTKKEQLRERGRKYARMLSGWAYSRFYDLLESILSNRGIYLMKVNPAYTSVIGLVKYARQYGLASDEAAAMAIARRGMRLKENIPGSITAYLSVKDGKHVWSLWNQLNKIFKSRTARMSRHSFYRISNWGLVVKEPELQSDGTKRKRASS